MPPTFSIVMPVGSVGPELGIQLRAVQAQHVDEPFEVVLSVNTPSSEAQAHLDQLLHEVGDHRIRTVSSSDRRGASHARNVGARAAKSDRLLFCDADDEVDPGWAKAMLASLGGHGAIGGVMNDERFTPPGTRPLRAPATPNGLPTFLGIPYIVSASLAMSRQAFEDVGGFDTDLTRCEDIAISWALLNKGYTIGFCADGLVHYRPRSGLGDMLKQHYLYGIGMSEVLNRYPMPGSGTTGRSMFTANNQPSDEPKVQRFLRRSSIAVGRLRGLAQEKLRRSA